MPGPAARLGDTTAHGGTIVLGFPQVLIGGMPAARLTDMHVCPMATPAPVPVPHVGGPVTGPGVPTVLIGNMPAATMGDMLVCVGPPDVIAMGCMTVILGTAGSGAGSQGSGGGGASAGATASAASAQFDNLESVTEEKNWIEFQFVDSAGNPVSGVPYKLTDPDGNESESVLRLDGTIRRDAVSEGEGEVVLMSVHNAQWSTETAKVGEKVTMTVDVDGFEDGTRGAFEVVRRDGVGPDVTIDQVPADVSGGSMKADWVFTFGPDEVNDGDDRYAAAAFYFVAVISSCTANSSVLEYNDILEIELRDKEGKPIANEPFIVYLSSGEVRKGELDANGKAKLEGVPPGASRVVFPNQSEISETSTRQ